MLGGNWDRELLLILNSWAGADTLFIWKLGNNDFFRGFPIFFAVVALWFSTSCEKRQSLMLTGLLVVSFATVFSVWLQFHSVVHTRPILDPTLPLKIVEPSWPANFDRTGSFPSDTGTLFFSLATVVFLESPLIGLSCFVWIIGIIALPRVMFGWHYPSDLLGSFLLGAGAVTFFSKIAFLRLQFERTLIWFEGRMYFVHALLFVYLAEAYNMFRGVQGTGKLLIQLFTRRWVS